MINEKDLDELEDVPKGGPLAEYRAKASFNWKKIKLFFEEIELFKYKVNPTSFSFIFDPTQRLIIFCN
jgi:hypothetical protein